MMSRILRAFPFALVAVVCAAAFTALMVGLNIYAGPLMSLAHVLSVIFAALLAWAFVAWKGGR